MSLMHTNEVEFVRHARRSVSMIRRRLLKPTVEALDGCEPHLNNAIESIGWLQARLGARESQSPGARERLQTGLAELRRELSHVTALMRNAAGFYGALVRLLSTQEDDLTGYAPNGAISSRARPTLQFEG